MSAAATQFPSADLPEGGLWRGKIGRVPVVATRVEGEVRTFVALCTHKGVYFKAVAYGGAIQCPLHEVDFEPRSGTVLRNPECKHVPEGLRPLRTIEERETVTIALGEDDLAWAERWLAVGKQQRHEKSLLRRIWRAL